MPTAQRPPPVGVTSRERKNMINKLCGPEVPAQFGERLARWVRDRSSRPLEDRFNREKCLDHRNQNVAGNHMRVSEAGLIQLSRDVVRAGVMLDWNLSNPLPTSRIELGTYGPSSLDFMLDMVRNAALLGGSGVLLRAKHTYLKFSGDTVSIVADRRDIEGGRYGVVAPNSILSAFGVSEVASASGFRVLFAVEPSVMGGWKQSVSGSSGAEIPSLTEMLGIYHGSTVPGMIWTTASICLVAAEYLDFGLGVLGMTLMLVLYTSWFGDVLKHGNSLIYPAMMMLSSDLGWAVAQDSIRDTDVSGPVFSILSVSTVFGEFYPRPASIAYAVVSIVAVMFSQRVLCTIIAALRSRPPYAGQIEHRMRGVDETAVRMGAHAYTSLGMDWPLWAQLLRFLVIVAFVFVPNVLMYLLRPLVSFLPRRATLWVSKFMVLTFPVRMDPCRVDFGGLGGCYVSSIGDIGVSFVLVAVPGGSVTDVLNVDFQEANPFVGWRYDASHVGHVIEGAAHLTEPTSDMIYDGDVGYRHQAEGSLCAYTGLQDYIFIGS